MVYRVVDSKKRADKICEVADGHLKSSKFDSFIIYFQATTRFLAGHLNGLSLVNTPSFSV